MGTLGEVCDMNSRVPAWVVTVGLVAALAAPAAGQGKPKQYRASHDEATVVVRQVLDQHGWVFVRVEDKGPDRVVYYRRGNRGRGRGLGPVESFVIRRVERRVVFVNVPDLILVDIDVKLKF
jgi:uncharacterized protein (UPF0548 family)